MDDADLADLHTEQEMALRLANRPTGREMLPKGACHNCDADLPPEQLYCDAACAADHQWHLKRAAIPNLTRRPRHG